MVLSNELTKLDAVPRKSAEALAPEAFLSTVTAALGEAGYYVFPIAVVDQMMKENGLPTAGEMHAVPLAKLSEVFGADAVMYVAIKQWQIDYMVVRSATTVRIEYLLVDIKSGTPLWKHEQVVTHSAGGLSVAGMIEAAADAAVSAATDRARDLAVSANQLAFHNEQNGLIKGHRHPDHEQDLAAKTAAQATLDQGN